MTKPLLSVSAKCIASPAMCIHLFCKSRISLKCWSQVWDKNYNKILVWWCSYHWVIRWITLPTRDVKFGIQIVSFWPELGQIWDFLRSVPVHFGSSSQNVLKSVLKSPGCVLFGANITDFITKSGIHGYENVAIVVFSLLGIVRKCWLWVIARWDPVDDYS